jgi:two-component system nitrogen regulation sensor histidine kinase GlnL
MNTFQYIILLGVAGNLTIGFLVWGANSLRSLNRYFLLTTFFIVYWLIGLFSITLQTDPAILTFISRQVSLAAALLPLGFFVLCRIILEPQLTFLQLCFRIRYLLLAFFSIAVICHTDFYLKVAYFTNPLETVPVADYGLGFVFYILYFLAMIIGMAVSFRNTLKNSRGVQRTESQFLLLGWMIGVSVGVVLYASGNLFGTQEVARFLPLVPLVMNSFVAYGIATRRILSVSMVVQRVVAYILMGLYLSGVYVLSVWVARATFNYLVTDTTYLSHLLAALVLAFSVVPANGWMQTVSHRLFASANLLNVNVVLEKAAHMLQEVSTEASLMEKFSELIEESFGTTSVILLRPEKTGIYCQAYPVVFADKQILFDPNNSVVQLLGMEHEAFTVDTLQRMRPTPRVSGALEELGKIGSVLAIGSFMRKEMKAILLLPPKKSARIYDLRDQRALQLLCDQLAVALENSSLYTAVQNGKIYNDILLDSLTSGIVAVNSDRIVTVFNQRAQKLTGVPESAVVDQPMDVLPPALIEGLDSILNTQSGFRDRDMAIPLGEDDLLIRVSGSMFRGHTGNLLGALIVFNDMTVLKKMEEQIRRTDRLSSIGTLSAGMAHEIKNPLVTIKTFTQLLPHQHADNDFRNTFFDLVGQEVKRIDTIVNRLLNFARPAKAALKPVSLHDVIENSLRLVEQQLLQHDIQLDKHLVAKRYMIEADAEQLNQTFVNFFLNAVHAMGKEGTLTVRTAVVRRSEDMPLANNGWASDRIQLDVQDTGCGIQAATLSKIFDPFFTTKEEGVGLGLSVSHGIIQEHGGIIDVESEPGTGTVFHVQFPLLKEKK